MALPRSSPTPGTDRQNQPEDRPEDRALRARLAAHASWAATPDRAARTAPARAALADRFERQVDPDGVMDPVERAKRAASARTAFYTRLAYRSVKARRAKAAEGG
jgi:hypothetical protein